MGTKYTIYDTETKTLEVDIDELKGIFRDEWVETYLECDTELDFLRGLIDDLGVDGLNESYENGPWMKVDGELSIVCDD